MTSGRGWPFWTYIALLVIIYFALHLALGLGAVVPDLLTIAVLMAARRLGAVGSAAFGLAMGVLRDALSLVAFGADAIALTIVGYIGARSRDLFLGDSLLFVATYLFVGKWFHDVIYYGIAGRALGVDLVSRLLVQAPIGAVYAAAAGIVSLLAYRLVTGDR